MGPDETIGELARVSGPRLLRLAYQLTHDRSESEDVVQEALTNMYRTWRRKTPDVEHLEAYARRAVVNEFLRRARKLSSGEIVTDALPDAGAPDELERVHDRDALWRALELLPARQRAVLVLRYYEDLADDRIAELLGARPATVRSLAARGLAGVRAGGVLSGGLP